MANLQGQNILFQISARNLSCITMFLPIFATLFCVIYSVLYDFKESTATHCKVKNYLPSISSAIGGFTPQRYVWRICIALHSAPRMLVASSYYRFHSDVHAGPRNNLYQLLVKICISLHVIENLALVLLTFISSTENHAVHENSFIVFMVCSQVYMLLTCFLVKWGRTQGGRKFTEQERQSFKYKVALFIFNVSAFLTAVYLFFRHNWYCEPGVYSRFALCEYLVVISNVGFHSTFMLDLPYAQFVLHRFPQKEFSIPV
ncbi:hypothetical protein CHS0354_023588 [Potamilus streckersoni]|uniref:CWH43-like N-terminal domain-containing protein n=1 Tax=Potamilus streckersoni TaxID=2493646 RepID=A0AAE0SM14_9BIVA|nr:hypothetical protein CHS0354_023588 [Potamilus streckersoni]